jgi:copper chaperone CopZ
VAGVVAGSVDLAAKRVRVEYDPTAVDPADIAAAIEGAGYPVS